MTRVYLPAILGALWTFGPGTATVGAQTSALFGSRALSGWRTAAEATETWDSNPRLLSVDPAPDLVSRAQVDAARLWQTPRTRLELAASGAVVRFRSTPELDRTAHNVSLQATRRLARRATGSLQLRTQSDLTGRSVTPSGDGPLLGTLASVRTQDVSGGVNYQASRVVSTRAGAEYERTTFDNPLLRGGRTAAVDVELTRRQGPASTVALGYEFRHTNAAALGVDAHRLTATVQKSLGKHVDAELSAGALNTAQRRATTISLSSPLTSGEPSSRSTPSFSGVGGGAVRVHRLRDVLAAEYQHSVGPVFGSVPPALYTTDVVVLDYRRALMPHLSVGASTRYAWSTEADAVQRRIQSTEAETNVRYAWASGFTASFGGVRSRRVDVVTIRDSRAVLTAGWAWSQIRRASDTAETP